MPQRHNNRTSERGDIDYFTGFKTLNIGKCVAQYQSAPSVGIQNFDGLPDIEVTTSPALLLCRLAYSRQSHR